MSYILKNSYTYKSNKNKVIMEANTSYQPKKVGDNINKEQFGWLERQGLPSGPKGGQRSEEQSSDVLLTIALLDTVIILWGLCKSDDLTTQMRVGSNANKSILRATYFAEPNERVPGSVYLKNRSILKNKCLRSIKQPYKGKMDVPRAQRARLIC